MGRLRQNRFAQTGHSESTVRRALEVTKRYRSEVPISSFREPCKRPAPAYRSSRREGRRVHVIGPNKSMWESEDDDADY